MVRMQNPGESPLAWLHILCGHLLLPRDSARSWMSGGQAAVASMSEGDLRERLSLVAQLKEEGLLDPEAVVCDSISFLTLFVHSRLLVRVLAAHSSGHF